MKILRTPDERFSKLAGYPFEPNYSEVPDSEGGILRIHYIDEGSDNAEIIRWWPLSSGRLWRSVR